MGLDAVLDNRPKVAELSGRETLKRLFSGWATQHGFPLVAAEKWEEEIESGGRVSFEAPYLGLLADPPDDTEWTPGLDQTRQGVLVATDVLPTAIENLQRRSYESGEFVESGGMLFGLRCIDLEGRPYSTVHMYLPLPSSARATSGSIQFTADSLRDIQRAVDFARAKYNLNDVVATGWIHSHPGIAFESPWDTVAHGTGSGGGGNFYGIVVGNELLRRGIPVGQENATNLGQEIADRQLHLITSNQKPGSVGLANRVAMAEKYFDKNTLEAAELPYVLQPAGSGELTEHGDQSDQVPIVITPDVHETRPSGSVRVELLDRQEDAQGPDIILTFDELQEVRIEIADVNQDNLPQVLDWLKNIFGY